MGSGDPRPFSAEFASAPRDRTRRYWTRKFPGGPHEHDSHTPTDRHCSDRRCHLSAGPDERPEAQSRLTAGYMVFYSIGSALGSSGSTLVYAQAGWTGVSLLGAAIAAIALAFWAATLKAMPSEATRAVATKPAA